MQQSSKICAAIVAASVTSVVSVVLFAGCGGGGGSIGGGINNNPGVISTPIPGGGAATPTPGGVTSTPTPVGSPLPTPVPSQILTSVSASGSFNAATGQFTQTNFLGQSGANWRADKCVPGPTPVPFPTSTPGPTPTPLGQSITIYSGNYSLSDGETGTFQLSIPGNDPNSALALAFPTVDESACTLQNVSSGSATINNLTVNGSTGSGSMTLTAPDGQSTIATGTITINTKQVVNFRAKLNKQLQSLVAKSVHRTR